MGEYFTPRHIVKFLVRLVNPKFEERIYDPFCGTGGILIESFKHLHKYSPINKSTLEFIKKKSLFGREISTTKLYSFNTFTDAPIITMVEETIWSIDKNGKNVSRIINTEKIVGYEKVMSPTSQIGLMADEVPEEITNCVGGVCGISVSGLMSWNHNDIGKLIDENTLMKVSLCKLGETQGCLEPQL